MRAVSTTFDALHLSVFAHLRANAIVPLMESLMAFKLIDA